MFACNFHSAIFLFLFLFSGGTICRGDIELSVIHRLNELEKELDGIRQEFREELSIIKEDLQKKTRELSLIRRELAEKSREISRLNLDLRTMTKRSKRDRQIAKDLQRILSKFGRDVPRVPTYETLAKQNDSPHAHRDKTILDLERAVSNNTQWINKLYCGDVKGIHGKLEADVTEIYKEVKDHNSKITNLNSSVVENKHNVAILTQKLDIIKEIDCGSPEEHRHNSTLTVVNSTKWRGEATYTCDKGYKYISGTNKSWCTDNGFWTRPDISCQWRHPIERGYKFNITAQLWYRVYNQSQRSNWTSAAGTCREKGGVLISSTSPQRIELVDFLTKKYLSRGNEFVWVGCHKEGGPWVWTDGTVMNGTKWGYQPRPGFKCCVQGLSELWGFRCYVYRPFICELLPQTILQPESSTPYQENK